MVTPEFEKLEIRGQELRIMRGGSGAPLLWLRGADASDSWRDYMTGLAESFRVIAPEHPGFGNVERPAWLDDIGDMANFYFDVIKTLDLGPVHLAGHGLGGWLAAEMAIRDTRQLASLTLVDASGLLVREAIGEDPFLRNEEDAITDQFHDAGLAAQELEHRLTPETEDARIANQMVIAQLAWAPRWHDPHLRKWLHRIDIPTLIVWGEQDKIVPLAHAHEWHNAIAGSQLAPIAACGHVPPLEKTGEFVDLVSAFAKQVEQTREDMQ